MTVAIALFEICGNLRWDIKIDLAGEICNLRLKLAGKICGGLIKMLKKLLYKIAKGPFMGKIVGYAFQYCSWAIPVKKVYNRKEIFAFCHPRPSYENHIIISPKRAVKNLQQISEERFIRYFAKVWEAVKDISTRHPEYHDGFIIVANGGKRQEVQQVHFHMFTNHTIVNEYAVWEQEEDVLYSDSHICIVGHPNPNWEIHFVIKPVSLTQSAGNGEDKNMYFMSVLHSIGVLDAKSSIVQRGYSLVYQHEKNSDKGFPVFYIVSGKRVS